MGFAIAWDAPQHQPHTFAASPLLRGVTGRAVVRTVVAIERTPGVKPIQIGDRPRLLRAPPLIRLTLAHATHQLCTPHLRPDELAQPARIVTDHARVVLNWSLSWSLSWWPMLSQDRIPVLALPWQLHGRARARRTTRS